MTHRAVVSLGVAASIGPDVAAQLAPLVEEAGFHALWVNDTPGADALAVLEAVAHTTRRLTLATGVLPVDRRSAAEIAAHVEAARLPQDRLVLGIGSGQAKNGVLDLVRDAGGELRAALAAPVLVGALGPKMRRLAVEETDGVLLSWLTPDAGRAQAAQARRLRPDTHVALYVRTAVDPAAHERLRAETARYARLCVVRRELRPSRNRPRRHGAGCRDPRPRDAPERISPWSRRGRAARDHRG